MAPRTTAILWLLTGAGLGTCYHLRCGASSASPHLSGGMTRPAKHASPRPASDSASGVAAKLGAHGDTTEGIQTLAAYLAAWSGENEGAALRWTRDWISGDARQAEPRASGLLAELARKGASALALRIAGNLEEPLRWNMVDFTLSIQAATAPLDAWAATAGIADAGLRERAQLAVLTHGSDASLPDLADLAIQMPARTDAITGILKRWALQDPAALSEWLNANAVASRAKDLAASHLVLLGDSENRSAEIAAAWAESISDPVLRLDAMHAATREWVRQDPEAARAYLAASARLTAEQKAAIASTLGTGL